MSIGLGLARVTLFIVVVAKGQERNLRVGSRAFHRRTADRPGRLRDAGQLHTAESKNRKQRSNYSGVEAHTTST